MLALLLLQTAVPQTAIDAERAFNQAAQDKGQWTAFREFAAEEGVMFVPQPIKAQAWLKDQKDPPRSVEWWPTESYVSCDGNLAVNTGGWKRPDGAVGYFTTVWKRQPDGRWKWLVDHGDTLTTPRATIRAPELRIASCKVVKDDRISLPPSASETFDRGNSTDATLEWGWRVDSKGTRYFYSRFWDGESFKAAIYDQVPAVPK